jgi:hypothetical protein
MTLARLNLRSYNDATPPITGAPKRDQREHENTRWQSHGGTWLTRTS